MPSSLLKHKTTECQSVNTRVVWVPPQIPFEAETCLMKLQKSQQRKAKCSNVSPDWGQSVTNKGFVTTDQGDIQTFYQSDTFKHTRRIWHGTMSMRSTHIWPIHTRPLQTSAVSKLGSISLCDGRREPTTTWSQCSGPCYCADLLPLCSLGFLSAAFSALWSSQMKLVQKSSVSV